MSIDRETFENASESELEEASTPDLVLGFLAANADRAFEASEIATRTGLEGGSVSTALSRLKSRGLVEHKATYWAITSNEGRLEDHAAYHRATALFNEQLGEENEGEWGEHAPDDAHPSLDDGG